MQSGPSPADLSALLSRHGLAGVLGQAIQSLDLWDDIPLPLAEQVRDARRRQRILAVQSLECMCELNETLSAAGIPHQFMKGPLLAHRVYGAIEARSVGDIDLLVRPDAVDSAEATLRRIGFEPRYRTLWGRRLSRAMTHHFALARSRQSLELHWLPAREPGVRLDLERLWRETEIIEVRGAHYPIPGLESSLLIQILAVVKDLELGHFRLRTAVDVFRILQALESEHSVGGRLNWRERLSCLDSQGLDRLAPAALGLVFRLFARDRELAALCLAAKARVIDSPRLEVFGSRPPAWKNKRILFRLHRGGSLRAWLWWVASLAWRRRVYQG